VAINYTIRALGLPPRWLADIYGRGAARGGSWTRERTRVAMCDDGDDVTLQSP